MMNFLSIGSRRRPDLAIDLGTANMRVMVRGEGVVFDEPSLCYYEKKSGQMKLIAAGLDVLAMVDRVPGTHLVRRPLARGVLQDMDAATALLAHGLTSVIGKKPSGRPPAMIGIPADATKAEANALLTAANDAGFGRIELVREPFAAAIGAELPVRESRASMVIECGAGTTEVAVFSINGQCRSRSVRLGGLDLDEAIRTPSSSASLPHRQNHRRGNEEACRRTWSRERRSTNQRAVTTHRSSRNVDLAGFGVPFRAQATLWSFCRCRAACRQRNISRSCR